MHIEIIGDGDAVNPGLCRYAERRLNYLLGRYANRVSDVLVRLTVSNAELGGGIDVFTRIAAWGRTLDGHVTTAGGSNPVAAIDQAADRLRREIGRTLLRSSPDGPQSVSFERRLAS